MRTQSTSRLQLGIGSYNAMLWNIIRVKEADLIWSSLMLSRQNYCMDKLLTKERLYMLHIPVDSDSCCLCEEGAMETQHHLFADY